MAARTSRVLSLDEPELDNGGGFVLRDAEFRALREQIYRETGIALSDTKKHLVQARLSKRLRRLGLASFADYLALLDSDASEDERGELINCITTNKTAFFREPQHFDFLRDRFIPEVEERARRTGTRRLRIWSAGCSTGEEPYTIAMVLAAHLRALASWDVSILASDIDTEVLRRAEEGIYTIDELEQIPGGAESRFLMRRRGGRAESFEIHPDLRRMVRFQRLNLVAPSWPISGRFDAIFCRNVLIYFDRPTQVQIYHKFHRYLEADGYMFGGHSENLHGLESLFALLGSTIYRPVGARRSALPWRPSRPPPSVTARPPSPQHESPPRAHHRQTRTRVDIHVGQLFASAEPTLICTLLGSCVAVCLFDPVARVGGMNHFSVVSDHRGPASLHSGPSAMTALVDELLELGAQRGRLRAKVFGAGRMFVDAAPTIPDGNSTVARAFLADAGIPIVAERLDIPHGLDVHFCTDTGQAFIKPILAAARDADRPPPLAAREARAKRGNPR